MKFNNSFQTESNGSLVLVPQAFLESLAENQNKILEFLQMKKSPTLTGDYVPEEEAKKEFGKGTTWFWERRKTGELPSVKVGSKVYYKRADLLKLFERASR
jgi:hypothetical protein